MASDLELLTLSILHISRPGGAGLRYERDVWEEKIRALAGEAFMLGTVSTRDRQREQEVRYRQEQMMGGDSGG